jgi:hypothetical protein
VDYVSLHLLGTSIDCARVPKAVFGLAQSQAIVVSTQRLSVLWNALHEGQANIFVHLRMSVCCQITDDLSKVRWDRRDDEQKPRQTNLFCRNSIVERFLDTFASDRTNDKIRETVFQRHKEV